MTTRCMLSAFPEEPHSYSIAYTYSDWHANIDPNCHGNCESDSDSQTNAHSETPCDIEAAANSGAKAGRSVSRFVCGLPSSGAEHSEVEDPATGFLDFARNDNAIRHQRI